MVEIFLKSPNVQIRPCTDETSIAGPHLTIFSVKIRNFTTNITLCIGPPDSGTKVFAEKLRPSRKKRRELYTVRLFGNIILFFLH